jgi:hypothetical protein
MEGSTMVYPKLVALPREPPFVTSPYCLVQFNLERMNMPQPDLVGSATANTEKWEDLEW